MLSAFSLAGRIEYDAETPHVVPEIVETLVEIGEHDDAIMAGETIKDPALRVQALTTLIRNLGESYYKHRDSLLDAAFQTCLEVDNVYIRDRMRRDIVKCLAQIGRIREATDVARNIEIEYIRDEAEFAIGVAKSKAGNRQAGRAIFCSILDAAKGDDVSERIRTERLRALIDAELQASEFDLAIAAAQEIREDEDHRAEAFERIAVAQASCGKPNEALRTSELILTGRGRHLPQIAMALSRSGHGDQLKQILFSCISETDSAYQVCTGLAQACPIPTSAPRSVIPRVL